MTWRPEELNIPTELDVEAGESASDANESAALRAWMNATSRSFLMGRMSDNAFERWWQTMIADGQQVRRVTDDGVLVGTWADFAWQLDLGAGTTPFWAITDVTVRPTHRRRGMLRDMMVDALERAVAAGMPMAGLTVSEGSIYGRFGFGVAGSVWGAEILTRDFQLRTPVPGSIDLVDPGEIADHYDSLVAQSRRTWPGVFPMTQHREMTLATWDHDQEAPPTDRYAAVHRSEDGEVDGCIVWKPEKSERRTVQLLSAWGSGRAVLALIEFCAHIDLVEVMRLTSAPPIAQLQAAVTDPRAITVSSQRDLLWLRPLDVPACLAARPWGADGVFTLQVNDPLGHADGTWRVTVQTGRATAEPVAANATHPAADDAGQAPGVAAPDSAPGLTVDVDTLGSLLGEGDLHDLLVAGRVEAHRGVDELTRIFAVNPASWQNIFF